MVAFPRELLPKAAWSPPRLSGWALNSVGGDYWTRNLAAPPGVDWSQPIWATRIVALSLPAWGSGGTAKWYFGDGRWGRVTEPAFAFALLAEMPLLPIVYMGGPGQNGFTVRELRLIPTYHRDDTVVATFNSLAAKWGATV